MKKTWSISDMAQAMNDVFSPAAMVSVTANSVSNILSSTRGREKVLSLIQYAAQLYKETMKSYVLYKDIESPISLKNAKSIESSMSNGRKLFRVLMFVDEYANIEKIVKTRNLYNEDGALKLLSHCASFVYYILDNLVWAADIGIINKFIYNANIKWKRTKDLASLTRCICELILSFFNIRETQKKLKLLESQLDTIPSSVLTKDSKVVEILRNLVQYRSNFRYDLFDLIQNILRLLMLCKSLRLLTHSNMSNTFVAICGILASLLSLFKMLTQKPRILSINPKSN
jgi:hypothetical protein